MKQLRSFILDVIKESVEDTEDTTYITPVGDPAEADLAPTLEEEEAEDKVAEAFNTAKSAPKKAKVVYEDEYDAYGKLIPQVDDNGNPIKRKEQKPFVNFVKLFAMARHGGYTSAKLLDPDLDYKKTATDLAGYIQEFRDLPKTKKEIKDIYGIDTASCLAGTDLISAIETSLVRGRFYFWMAFEIFQTSNTTSYRTVKGSGGKETKDKNVGDVYATLPWNNLYARLFTEPTDFDLEKLLDMFREVSPEKQKIILSKQDRLHSYLGKAFVLDKKKKEVEESYINVALKNLVEVKKIVGPPKVTDADIRNRHELNRKRDIAASPIVAAASADKLAGSSVATSTPQSFAADSVAMGEEAKNQIFNRYLNGILRNYCIALQKDIPLIDQKIEEYTAHPISIYRDIRARRRQFAEQDRAKGDKSNRSLLSTSPSDLSLIDFEKKQENPAEADQFLDSTGDATDDSNIIFGTNNFLIRYFSNINYASFVGYLLEIWAKQPDKYLVTLFSKADKKLVNINLIHYLYANSTIWLNTKDTKISTLQVDVLCLIEYLQDIVGNPVIVTEEIKAQIADKVKDIIKIYKLYDFNFVEDAVTNNVQREELRQALGIDEIPAYKKPDAPKATSTLFKDKIIDYIESPYFTAIPREVKPLVVKRLLSHTDAEDFIEDIYKILPGPTIENLLRVSSDKQLYSASKEAAAAVAAAAVPSKKEDIVLARSVASGLLPFKELDKNSLIKYFTIGDKKIADKELPKFLLATDVETLLAVKRMIQDNLDKLPQNSKVLDNLTSLIQMKEKPLTESVETNVNEYLQSRLLTVFVESLIAPLQEIGAELHKLGLFLIAFSQSPGSYLPDVKSDSDIVTILRSSKYRINKVVIAKILAVYNEQKDKPLEFDPMLNPSFSAAFSKMKDWLIVTFSGSPVGKQIKQAIQEAEDENNWVPLQHALKVQLPKIKEMLGSRNSSRGDRAGGSILNSIEGLCYGRYVVSRASDSPTQATEDELAATAKLQKQRKALGQKFGSLFAKPITK